MGGGMRVGGVMWVGGLWEEVDGWLMFGGIVIEKRD